MKFSKTFSLSATVALALMSGCTGNSGGSGYQTDATTGIQYQFYNHDANGAKPSMGDYATLYLVLKNANDSVIFDSHHKKHEDTSVTMKMHLKNTFKGCLADGITMMAAGDSASFKVNADSLYLISFHSQQLPPFIKQGSMVTFYVKLLKFETPEQMSDDMAQAMKEREAKMDSLKAGEPAEIEKYLADNNIKVKPESDGIYILERKKGKGKMVKQGDSVEVKYTGMLLDGTVVETSDKGPGRTTFTLVYGKDYFIKGFDDIITNLDEGGSVKALIPSSLAFGQQKQGELILPYTPLIYQVEIIKVKS